MVPVGSMRLICYSDDIKGQQIHVSSNCLPVKRLNTEPAGHAFHAAALKLSGFIEEENIAHDKSDSSNDKEQSFSQSIDSYGTKGKKKSGSETKQQDHYAILGLSHLRFFATEAQIKKGYCETGLKHYSLFSKETEAAKEAKKDEMENHFTIQEAYEVLLDLTRRRNYDNTYDVDDEIPTDCAPQDFFKDFGSSFTRNGRWSVNQPVLSLGDDKTPIKEVDSFYEFWYNFKSRRMFPHLDEFNLEKADSKAQRSRMEKRNRTLLDKARKKERARICSLVEKAYKQDPRIMRKKEEEKTEKQRKKDVEVLAKKKK